MSRPGDNTGSALSDMWRRLPSLHDLLGDPSMAELCLQFSRELTVDCTRAALGELRHQIRSSGLGEADLAGRLSALPEQVRASLERRTRPRLRRVINATGVLLQTNLGRAPLSEAALARVVETARGYSSLEYDVEGAHRSYRDANVEDLMVDVLRAHGSCSSPEMPLDRGIGVAVVNNCAAATFLALNTLAEGGEVIVSRGELVEIGGGFRIPEILTKSGATLREVGTTNKTRLSDYAAAIGPATRLILRVHRSNFRIEGFTEQPSLEDLVGLARETSVPLFHDQGTGCLLDLAQVGLPGESSWLKSVTSGASLVACSGDKLLGGPQCGLLVGEPQIIERLRANPLFRALRVDKLTYAALESTLLAYLTESESSLPLVRMLRTAPDEIRSRCEWVAAALDHTSLAIDVVPTKSVVGGGTTPGASLPSFAVGLRAPNQDADALAKLLRSAEPPIITRIHDGVVLLDLRTVHPNEDREVASLLAQADSKRVHV